MAFNPDFKLFAIIILFFSRPAFAQYAGQDTVISADTLSTKVEWQGTAHKKISFVPSVLIPAMAVSYGFAGLESKELKKINLHVKEEVYTEHPHKEFHADNYLQFTPAIAVYGLNAVGIKGENNLVDRSGIYLLSNIMLNGASQALKRITKVNRPDGSANTSFPSGHTAEAFASAEFLRHEYRHVSPWYGIAGYAVAATTGYLRIYNNRHWLNDVIEGAGIGVFSTEASYWLYPKLKKVFFPNTADNAFILPWYQNGSFGVAIAKTF